jgi:DTW domain-containing protein YfiP
VKTRFLILQHPQESRKPLSTARVASLALGATHKVGLSWRSLTAALGEPAQPREWAVLFLGSLKDSKKVSEAPFQIVTSKGGAAVPLRTIKGIVILDGNWKQSKTLWWRNPWLLRLHRVILRPEAPSAYGSARKEPRRECLSSIEAIAESVTALESASEPAAALRALFKKQLDTLTSTPSSGETHPGKSEPPGTPGGSPRPTDLAS